MGYYPPVGESCCGFDNSCRDVDDRLCYVVNSIHFCVVDELVNGCLSPTRPLDAKPAYRRRCPFNNIATIAAGITISVVFGLGRAALIW